MVYPLLLLDLMFVLNMKLLVSDIMKSFETTSKTRSGKYKDFLAYIYLTFDKKISLCKVDKEMNKYKKMRNSILQYIVANERAITAEICKIK
jgi:hypothetical protein